MNSFNMVSLIVFAFLMSCNADNVKLAQAPEKSFYAKFVFQDSSGIMYYECEDFADAALDNYTIADLNSAFAGELSRIRHIQPVKNIHDPSVTDTIYTYSYERNIIQFYKAAHAQFIFTFDVTDPKLSLANTIHTGMTKKDFARKLHIDDNFSDLLVVRNSTSSVQFLFYFKQDLLYRINSSLYLD